MVLVGTKETTSEKLGGAKGAVEESISIYARRLCGGEIPSSSIMGICQGLSTLL